MLVFRIEPAEAIAALVRKSHGRLPVTVGRQLDSLNLHVDEQLLVQSLAHHLTAAAGIEVSVTPYEVGRTVLDAVDGRWRKK